MVNKGHTQLHIVPISFFVTLRGFRVRGIYRQEENANRAVGRRLYVGEDQANDCPARLLCDTALRAGHDGIEEMENMENKVESVATIQERELVPTIREWLRPVNMVPGSRTDANSPQ
jgi:hypothetical protein